MGVPRKNKKYIDNGDEAYIFFLDNVKNKKNLIFICMPKIVIYVNRKIAQKIVGSFSDFWIYLWPDL